MSSKSTSQAGAAKMPAPTSVAPAATQPPTPPGHTSRVPRIRSSCQYVEGADYVWRRPVALDGKPSVVGAPVVGLTPLKMRRFFRAGLIMHARQERRVVHDPHAPVAAAGS